MIDFSRPTALFGGSFDPIHEGHIHIAKSVLRLRPEIEQLVFVPAAHSPGKSNAIASSILRLRWVNLVAEAHGFLAWDEEIRRGGESYTVTTLRAAHRNGSSPDKLYWVVGGDSYAQLARWREPEEIRKLCRIIAVNRPGIVMPAQQTGDIILEINPHPASSTEIRAALEKGNDSLEFLPEPVRQDLKALFLRSANPYARKKE